jgi:hypothetical protein
MVLLSDPTARLYTVQLCNICNHILATDNGDACAVCGDEEALENNAIVFCDGCGLALHQECAATTAAAAAAAAIDVCCRCASIVDVPGEDEEYFCMLCTHKRSREP